MKFVAVTSCPTGIAHTYMAAEALEQAARDAGHEIHVETQGAGGLQALGQDVIDAADAVIFAADEAGSDTGAVGDAEGDEASERRDEEAAGGDAGLVAQR